eukprot:2010358-Lingulodinium_polyedra.AAC.1
MQEPEAPEASPTGSADEGNVYLLDSEAERRGKGLLDCGATDSVGGYQAVEDLMPMATQERGQDAVQVDLKDQPVYRFGNGGQMQCLSKAYIQVSPQGCLSQMDIHALPTPNVPVLISRKSLRALQATVNFANGRAVFGAIDPQAVVQLEESPGGHLWMDLFRPMPVVGTGPVALLESA